MNLKIGDLAIWNNHVEFVVAYDGNYIALSGSSGANGSAVPKTKGDGWLILNNMGDISDSGFLGFWTIQ